MWKEMKKVKLFYLVAFWLLYPSLSYCCSCIGESTITKELNRSNLVFKGRVIAKKVINISDPQMPYLRFDMVEYTLKAEIIFKGKIKHNNVIIVTGLGSGDCGFNFEIEKDYIVYSSFENRYYPKGSIVSRFLYTDNCRRTRLVANNKKEIATLKRLTKRDKQSNKKLIK